MKKLLYTLAAVLVCTHNLQNKWVRVQKNEKVRFWEN